MIVSTYHINFYIALGCVSKHNTHPVARRRNSLLFIVELVIFHRLARKLLPLQVKFVVGSSNIFNIFSIVLFALFFAKCHKMCVADNSSSGTKVCLIYGENERLWRITEWRFDEILLSTMTHQLIIFVFIFGKTFSHSCSIEIVRKLLKKKLVIKFREKINIIEQMAP